MKEILYRLQALYQFYKSAHWLSKGEAFYQNHLLFEKLYAGFDDDMDTLIELLLITVEDDDCFLPDVVLKEAAKLIPTFGTFKENVTSALEAEHELMELLEKVDENKVPTGLYNFIATLSQTHTHKAYLLSRILG